MSSKSPQVLDLATTLNLIPNFEFLQTQLQEAVQNQQNVSLNLSNKQLNDTSLLKIINILSTTTGACLALQEIDLSCNAITDEAATVLARDLLPSCPNLTTLKLSFNSSITPKALKLIVRAMKRQTAGAMRSLALKHNKLGREGAQILAKALLRSESRLRQLDLTGNYIGDEGFLALIEALAVNNSLEELCLWSNGITDKHIPKLAQVIATNKCLRVLNMASNEITESGVAILASLFATDNAKQNTNDNTAASSDTPQLCELELVGNPIKSRAKPLLEVIRRALNKNQEALQLHQQQQQQQNEEQSISQQLSAISISTSSQSDIVLPDDLQSIAAEREALRREREQFELEKQQFQEYVTATKAQLLQSQRDWIKDVEFTVLHEHDDDTRTLILIKHPNGERIFLRVK